MGGSPGKWCNVAKAPRQAKAAPTPASPAASICHAGATHTHPPAAPARAHGSTAAALAHVPAAHRWPCWQARPTGWIGCRGSLGGELPAPEAQAAVTAPALLPAQAGRLASPPPVPPPALARCVADRRPLPQPPPHELGRPLRPLPPPTPGHPTGGSSLTAGCQGSRHRPPPPSLRLMHPTGRWAAPQPRLGPAWAGAAGVLQVVRGEITTCDAGRTTTRTSSQGSKASKDSPPAPAHLLL